MLVFQRRNLSPVWCDPISGFPGSICLAEEIGPYVTFRINHLVYKYYKPNMHQGFPSHLSSLATAAASWQLSTIFSTSANFGLLLNQNEAPAIGDDSSTPASGHSSNSMLPNVWIYAPLEFRKKEMQIIYNTHINNFAYYIHIFQKHWAEDRQNGGTKYHGVTFSPRRPGLKYHGAACWIFCRLWATSTSQSPSHHGRLQPFPNLKMIHWGHLRPRTLRTRPLFFHGNGVTSSNANANVMGICIQNTLAYIISYQLYYWII